MEKIKEFFHKHPIETALLGGVALIALYYALFSSGSSNSGASQEAALQQDYFQAEGIQAQSNAAVQIAGIQTSAATSQNATNDATAQTLATTYANENEAINTSNNNTAVASLPYAEESNLIDALSAVASQPPVTTSTKVGGINLGLFRFGGGTHTTTQSTQAASSASDYLGELANGLFAQNG